MSFDSAATNIKLKITVNSRNENEYYSVCYLGLKSMDTKSVLINLVWLVYLLAVFKLSKQY